MRTVKCWMMGLGALATACGSAGSGTSSDAGAGVAPLSSWDAALDPGWSDAVVAQATDVDDAAATAVLTASFDASGASDACVASAVDPPDDMGADTNCDGADGIVGVDVYVDPTSGQDTSDGTPSAPLQTLGKAAPLAASRGGHVLVAAGTIAGDSLPFTGNWSLYGGYTTSFVGAPNRAQTIFAPSAAGLLVDATTATGALVHVTVQAQAPSLGATQLSAHAVRTRAAQLTLDDVVLEASDAALAPAAAVGANGETPTNGQCAGVPEPPYALGTAYASPDGVTSTGSVSGTTATPAAQATSGYPAGDGRNASSVIALDANGMVSGGLAAPGLSNGTPGFGGAGGAEADGWDGEIEFVGGVGGNGGCPGVGGSPGQSGGSSVALLVLAGEVAVTRSELHAGFGGAGGNGGPGGPGGAGAPGGPATWISFAGTAPAWCKPNAFGACTATMRPTCTPASDELQANCAEYGGQGGNGGAGGSGGAGAGGWSVGVLSASAATTSLDAVTTVYVAKPGTGGQGPGGANAPPGESVTTLTLQP